jgi:hypothetical protein
VQKKILYEDAPRAKLPSYSIVYDKDDIIGLFASITVKEDGGCGTIYERRAPIISSFE